MAIKVWSTLYTNNPPPGNKPGIKSAITIGAGNMRCVAVPVGMSEGLVSNVIVKQTGGTGVDFSIELLCSKKPYPVGEAAVATAPDGTVEIYRVVNPISAVAGGVIELTPEYEFGWPFRNVDGDWTMNERFLYLIIKPVAAGGSTTWDALIMGHSG